MKPTHVLVIDNPDCVDDNDVRFFASQADAIDWALTYFEEAIDPEEAPIPPTQHMEELEEFLREWGTDCELLRLQLVVIPDQIQTKGE